MTDSKRNRWLLMIAAAVLIAAGVTWWLAGRPGAPAVVTAFLPAEGISAALFIDDPADLFVALERRFAAEEGGVLDLDEIVGETDFEPRKVESWERVGVDEGAGIAAVLYAGTGAAPIVLLEVDDERAFYEWLNVVFDGPNATPVAKGDMSELDLGRTQLLIGRRGPFTAIMRAGPHRRAGFEAFLQAGGRLTAERQVLRMFLAADSRPRMVAFARTRDVVNLLDEPGLARLVRGAPMISGFLDDAGGAVRISTSKQGQTNLARIFDVAQPAPVFSRLLPSGWSALRLSFNVPVVATMFKLWLDSIGNPTDQPAWWPYAQGFATVLERMGEVFTGHVVIAVSNESLSTWLAQPEGAVPDWIVFAHVSKPPTASQLADLPAATRLITGSSEILAFGPSADQLAAIKPLAADVDPPDEHRILDGDAIFGLTIEASELLGAVEGAIPPSVFALFKSSELARKARLAVGFARDDAGIVSRGDAGALLVTAGLAGLIVAPELSQRRRARQQVEARTFVKRIADGAVAAWQWPTGEARRFPPSAGPTPKAPPSEHCSGYPVQPSNWDAPGWQALGFGIFGSHRYQYSFESDGRRFTARAVGDLDCDAVLSTFEVIGRVERGDIILEGQVIAPLE